MAKPAQEIVEKKDQLPATIDFAADARVGVEGLGSQDVSLPFLIILQKGSPQIDVDHPDHAQYADRQFEVGDIFDTLTQETYDSVTVVNCGYVSCLVEWKPREQGGGYVAQHPVTSDLLGKTRRNEKNQDVLPNGNLLVTTHYHFCLLVDEDSVSQCIISMTSTQLKKSRRWNALLMKMKAPGPDGPITPARFASMWELGTVAEKNDRGTWRGWTLSSLGLITNPQLYAAAREFHKLVERGQVSVKPPVRDDGDVTEAKGPTPY